MVIFCSGIHSISFSFTLFFCHFIDEYDINDILHIHNLFRVKNKINANG